MTDQDVSRTEDEWRQVLSPQRYAVMRNAATEPAFTGTYTNEKADGIYRCGACQAVLFDASTKYDSGSGWPSFTTPVNADAVELKTDRSHGMVRTEVLCRNCGSHLGHVFDDGPGPSGTRFCMNSIALDLEKREPAGSE